MDGVAVAQAERGDAQCHATATPAKVPSRARSLRSVSVTSSVRVDTDGDNGLLGPDPVGVLSPYPWMPASGHGPS